MGSLHVTAPSGFAIVSGNKSIHNYRQRDGSLIMATLARTIHAYLISLSLYMVLIDARTQGRKEKGGVDGPMLTIHSLEPGLSFSC